MGDYGHDLTFGTFITPQNRRPDDVVALAVASERAGIDLVTFQDHPYQPAFLDSWTLVMGLLFVVVVLFLPKGIAGGFETIAARFGRHPAKPVEKPAVRTEPLNGARRVEGMP